MRLALFFCLLLCAQFATAATYHVHGECEKEVVSDRASLTVGVSTTDKAAAKAQEKSAKVYEAILAKIKAAKLSEEEIQTDSIQLYEDFDWSKGKKSSRGFVSSMTLRVSTADFTKLSQLMPAFTELGANQIGDLNLFVSKAVMKKAYRECLGLAGLEAREKAQAIQKEFSRSTLSLVEIRESSVASYHPPYAMKSAMMESSDAAVAPSIEAGKQKITVKVDAQFKD